MAASRYEQNEGFFVKMFSDPEMMNQIMDTLGAVLYERLNKVVRYDDIQPKLSMVAESIPEYGSDIHVKGEEGIK